MWTLVVCTQLACIVIDGFSRQEDCLRTGELNVTHLNPQALYRCEQTHRPPARCLPDKRTYGRTAECLSTTPR